MMDPNLIILAGGVSSRMKKEAGPDQRLDPALQRQAEKTSKSMIGVGEGRRPFLDYLLYNAREAGYRDVVIVVGEHDRSIQTYYAEHGNERPTAGLSLTFAVQSIPPDRTKPLGTADALLQGLRATPRWVGQQFTVCNSDNLYSRRAFHILLECRTPAGMIDYDRAALSFEPERIEQFAVIEKDERGLLVRIIEKPTPGVIERVRDRRGHVGVSMNIFRLPYDRILPFLESVPLDPVRREKELPAAIAMMIAQHPGSLQTFPLAEPVPDLTSQRDIPTVQRFLRDKFPDFTMRGE